MPDEVESILAICFGFVTVFGQRATIDLVIPEKELAIL